VVEEALAAGLPVIVSDAAGDIRARVPESVGRVFPVGDADALAAAMEALAEPSLRRAHGRSGTGLGRGEERRTLRRGSRSFRSRPDGKPAQADAPPHRLRDDRPTAGLVPGRLGG
jgi:glycosyltransferase involved in cell wall biosynthesis